MQEDNHIFQGLRRDNHQIRQDSKFLWDAHNIRLTNREDNTLLSITNEKGTSTPLLTFNEFYVGHCVLGKYLVIFTASRNNGYSYIYRVEKTDNGYKSIILYEGYLMLDPNNPIEAIGVYETKLVQKVYWIDGKHQPRVINITKAELIGIDPTDGESISNKLEYNSTSFDFIRSLNLKERIKINKSVGYGEFSPGTIQYAFTYFNKYEPESNIFYTSALQYISPLERGGNPEEKVSCSFIIEIREWDKFDYIRVYSIHRTSLDAAPTVKLVTDIDAKNVKDPYLRYTDTGTSGSIIDPTQLLYLGGASIIPKSFTSKDNTLFFGNLEVEQQGSKVIELQDKILSESSLIEYSTTIDAIINSTRSTYYLYDPNLNSYSAGFKVGERYRCGVQFQDKFGKWSDPIHINDVILNGSFVWKTYPNRRTKALKLTPSIISDLVKIGYKRARSCVVFPRTTERDIICQGVLCPTVYNVQGRISNYPYSMSSWFFRPAVNLSRTDSQVARGKYLGANIQYIHNKSLFTGSDRGAEIQSMTFNGDVANIKYDEAITNETRSSEFFVDENIVTFNSPDIEFDSSLQSATWNNTKLRIIGIVCMGAVSGDISIETSSPPLLQKANGFNHIKVGYQTNTNTYINNGLVSGLFYNDGMIRINESGEASTAHSKLWMVYPWHRSGSLNNDVKRAEDKGARSSVLQKKKISNLKFFDNNRTFEEFPISYNISTPQLFNSNELSMVKINLSYPDNSVPYLGNVDTLLTPKTAYNIYCGDAFGGSVDTPYEGETTSKEPVRIKYKSSPHLVFSLTSNNYDINLLPRYAGLASRDGDIFNIPDWQDNTSNNSGGGSGGTQGGNSSIPYDYILYRCSEHTPIPISTPSSEAIGTCSIGPAFLSHDGGKPGEGGGETVPKGGGVYIAEQSPSGANWRLLTESEAVGLVLKAVSGFTKVSGYRTNNGYLPGTSSVNYPDGSTYEGKDRYYKVGNIPTGVSNAWRDRLSEIIINTTPPEGGGEEGDNGGSENNSYDHILRQKSFGNIYKDAHPDNYDIPPYLLLAEIIRDNVIDKFGGESDSAKQSNLWLPAGEPVIIEEGMSEVIIPFEYGDTWYSRYDCLKTYPFTQEDENSVIEIGSFMCETRVNIDGRCDRNRGQLSNLTTTPQNFNLLNEVYSQKDNFFNYRILDKDYYKQSTFANQITWSKEKHAGEEIDTWANITLANTLDMDGEKGNVTALRAWNEYLLCFQEKALSQILFNSRVQIPTTDGAPIEISNGYKVDGSRLLGGNIGCSNKWAITTANTGIYFLDSNTDSLYIFNSQLANLSEVRGMDWWVRQNHTDKVWCPVDYGGTLNGVRAFYDNKYGDIYFTPGPVNGIDQPDALCYSEQLGQFTSLMSYGGTQAMFNFADGFYSLRENDGTVKLYQNNVGEYNNFYGNIKGWDFSFISNQNPTLTKIFDTVELRADHYQNDTIEQLLNSCPFNYIKVDNEYQHSNIVHLNNENMRKKFRVWRGLIPRNKGTRQRFRNPWSMITLGWNPVSTEQSSSNTNKAVVHDVSVKYTV